MGAGYIRTHVIGFLINQLKCALWDPSLLSKESPELSYYFAIYDLLLAHKNCQNSRRQSQDGPLTHSSSAIFLSKAPTRNLRLLPRKDTQLPWAGVLVSCTI